MLPFLLSLAALAGAQPSPERIVEAARAVMQSAEFCFLITVDGSTEPQARLMQPFAPDKEMKVWFGTNPSSRKVAQIRKNPRTTLAYYDKAGPNFVTLSGMARIVDAPAERRKHWRKEWEAFFPGGPEGKNFVAIEFTPQRMELISATHKIAVEPTSPPAILYRTSGGWTTKR